MIARALSMLVERGIMVCKDHYQIPFSPVTGTMHRLSIDVLLIIMRVTLAVLPWSFRAMSRNDTVSSPWMPATP